MKARIYKLQCCLTSKFYIGSTIHTLAYRLKKHRNTCKDPRRNTSPLYTHFREVGWENAEMTTIVEVEVESRRELLELEKAEILTHIGQPLCLNHNRPVITRDEKKALDVEYGKKRRANKKNEERNRVAEWRKNNPEKYAAQVRRSVEQQRKKRQS